MSSRRLKARVVDGRLVLDVPTNLPEGAEVWLAVIDGDELDDDERAALHASLERGIAQAEAGQLVEADVVMAKLRAKRR